MNVCEKDGNLPKTQSGNNDVSHGQLSSSLRFLTLWNVFRGKPTISIKNIAIKQVIEMIKEKRTTEFQMQEKDQQQYLNQVQTLFDQVKIFKLKFIQQYDTIIVKLQSWLSELNKNKYENSTTLLNELREFHSNHFQVVNIGQQQNIDSTTVIKLNSLFEKLLNQEEQKFCYSQLISLQQINKKKKESITNILTETQSKPKSCKQVFAIEQIQWSQGIAFNNSGSLIAACCGDQIKIWVFEKPKLLEIRKWKGHQNGIRCIVFFVKKSSWFASSDIDSTRRGWKDIHKFDWIGCQPKQEHFDSEIQILIYDNDTEMISCSRDQTIKVWKVNSDNNEIIFDYTLEVINKKQLCSISLNNQQNLLASCGEVNQIILCGRDKDGKWRYLNSRVTNDVGYRLVFINDTQIAWHQRFQRAFLIYDIINYRLQKKLIVR